MLLKWLLERLPDAEAYGVDASADMLEQAASALKKQPHVHLEQVVVGTGETAGLPYTPETFDLITFTNALHDLPEPAATLSGLKRLLVPGGQLVMEDFARHEAPFPWTPFRMVLAAGQRGAGTRLNVIRGTSALRANRASYEQQQSFHRELALARLDATRSVSS